MCKKRCWRGCKKTATIVSHHTRDLVLKIGSSPNNFQPENRYPQVGLHMTEIIIAEHS